MSISLNFNRYFDKPYAAPGETVKVITEISFVSPFYPSEQVYFTNVGDNLGGSSASSGPLKYVSDTVSMLNIFPNTAVKKFVGNGTSNGCMRIWTTGKIYPIPNVYQPSNRWKPINPMTVTMLKTEVTYRVTDTARDGTSINAPTGIIPPSLDDFTTGKIMMSIGSDMELVIETGPAPNGYYRTFVVMG